MTKRLMLMAALAACGPSRVAFTPAHATAPQDAFAKTTRVLIERGQTIETKDEAAGIIVTKWDESTVMGSLYRMRWSVTIANATITVNSQCQWRIKDETMNPSDQDWKPCDTQPETRNSEAKAIANEVSK